MDWGDSVQPQQDLRQVSLRQVSRDPWCPRRRTWLLVPLCRLRAEEDTKEAGPGLGAGRADF